MISILKRIFKTSHSGKNLRNCGKFSMSNLRLKDHMDLHMILGQNSQICQFYRIYQNHLCQFNCHKCPTALEFNLIVKINLSHQRFIQERKIWVENQNPSWEKFMSQMTQMKPMINLMTLLIP